MPKKQLGGHCHIFPYYDPNVYILCFHYSFEKLPKPCPCRARLSFHQTSVAETPRWSLTRG